MLERGVARGELSPALAVDTMLDALCGPILYRALSGASVSRRFVDTLVDHVLKDPRTVTKSHQD